MSITIAELILDWYDRQGRVLPWRFHQDADPDPYVVWLSEVMLQQTTVITVKPYFTRFLERWPTVEDLAAAELDEVLKAWAGLGYYARARNLHRCARYLVTQRKGQFPDTIEALRQLPGVGEYTAAIIAAIVFGHPTPVIDGNVTRIIIRLFAIKEPLPRAKSQVHDRTKQLVPQYRPGDFAQAMMDLGATVCTVTKPQCLLCPLRTECHSYALGITAALPHKIQKPKKPIRRGIVFWLSTSSNSILLRRRAEHGLLGGMIEVPSTPWRPGKFPDNTEILKTAPLLADWKPLDGIVHHSFTHFHLELAVMYAGIDVKYDGYDKENGFWVSCDQLSDYALPVVMQKVVRHVQTHLPIQNMPRNI